MRVKVDDARLFFDVDGAKLRPDGPQMREVPTLLLLHGGPGFDHSIWKPRFTELTDVAQIVYLDHRGNCRSEGWKDPQRLNLAQWGDDVRRFCEALEIEKPIVMGTSFGGMVALAYATRHPEHCGKVILCSTAARIRLDRSLDVFERLGGAEAKEIAKAFFENPGRGTMDAYVEKCFPLYTHAPRDPNLIPRTVMNSDLTAAFFKVDIKQFNFLPELHKIRCQTLVVGGDDDPITPIADQEDIVAAIPAGLVRFERFAQAGHAVVDDAPAAFFKLLREFILA